jgi:hypothetical protein
VLNENSNIVILKPWGVCRTQSCDPPRSLEVIWGMSNTVVSKLQGVCRIQLCDPSRGLEITWGLVQTEFLVAYVSVWQSALFWTVVALVEIMSSKFICLFWLRWESYACGGLLILLIHLMLYLSSWLLACYFVLVSLWGLTLVLQVLA